MDRYGAVTEGQALVLAPGYLKLTFLCPLELDLEGIFLPGTPPKIAPHPASISATSHFLHPALLLVRSQLTSYIFHLVIPLFLPRCNASPTEGREFCWSPLWSRQCLSISRYSIMIHGMDEPPMVGPFHK